MSILLVANKLESDLSQTAFFKVVVVFYAARRSFSGLSATILTGIQFLVFPDSVQDAGSKRLHRQLSVVLVLSDLDVFVLV